MSDFIIQFTHSIIFTASVIIFIRAILYRLRIIRKGQSVTTASVETGFRSFIFNVLFQEKLFKEPLRGIMHAFIFYGFIAYSFHTLGQMTAGNLWGLLSAKGINPYAFSILPGSSSGPLETGEFSLVILASIAVLILTFMTARRLSGGNLFHISRNIPLQRITLALLLAEFFFIFTAVLLSGSELYENIVRGFSYLVLAGLSYFAARRWIFRSKGLDYSSPQSAIVLSLIATLMLSTLFHLSAVSFAEGAHHPLDAVFYPLYEFLGNHLAESLGHAFWWIHLMTVYAFMIYVPTSKHAHLIFAPINFFLIKNSPRGQMPFVNLEDENAVWGSGNISEMTWKNMLDALSCIECGRCTVQCPANLTGKPLNPKKIMVDIKHAMMDHAPALLNHSEAGPAPSPVINENYITDEELWSCTACFACVEACPVGNNQADAILSMRKNLVLQESRFPSHLQNAFNNMERNSNPWGVAASSRADWCADLDVKLMAEDSSVDVLYWVGCAGAFDERNKKIARSFVKILKSAGVNFGILGTEESCTGDSARRGGNEYLFQMLAAQNIEIMNGYGVKKIVTACPHCFNTLKNEYPQMGGNYEVIHHSQYIDSLVTEGKLKLKQGPFADKKAVYHDSCYLGRHNDLYESPRSLLNNTVKSSAEACDSKSKSLCCGAGGAQMWMEEKYEKVNKMRTGQLLDTGADLIASACPFCNIMITDGVKASDKNEKVTVMDIAEIVAESISD